jgi:hypothetical protein
MSAESRAPDVAIGATVTGTGGVRIGRVDAVFVDYLLVRTYGIVPVDVYLPTAAAELSANQVRVDATPEEAYQRWHRPLKSVAHDADR